MSRRLLVMTLTLILALASISAGQEGLMPKPGPEYEALGFFTGTWRFEGEAMESPMGPAGKVTFTESCEWLQGRFALVCRSEGMNPTGPGSAIAISSYDPEQKVYTYYAAESNMPPFMATGQRKGKVWTYDMESKMDNATVMTRVTIAETSATSYSFEMETSTDGKTWTRVMEGTSTKSGS